MKMDITAANIKEAFSKYDTNRVTHIPKSLEPKLHKGSYPFERTIANDFVNFFSGDLPTEITEAIHKKHEAIINNGSISSRFHVNSAWFVILIYMDLGIVSKSQIQTVLKIAKILEEKGDKEDNVIKALYGGNLSCYPIVTENNFPEIGDLMLVKDRDLDVLDPNYARICTGSKGKSGGLDPYFGSWVNTVRLLPPSNDKYKGYVISTRSPNKYNTYYISIDEISKNIDAFIEEHTALLKNPVQSKKVELKDFEDCEQYVYLLKALKPASLDDSFYCKSIFSTTCLALAALSLYIISAVDTSHKPEITAEIIMAPIILLAFGSTFAALAHREYKNFNQDVSHSKQL